MWKTIWLAPILLSVAACAGSGSAIRPGCEWAKPTWLSEADVLTEASETAILTHNETWERVCGD